MKYTIKAIKKTQMPKKDGMGTWQKVQVKTQETGEEILDLGFGIAKNIKDNLKAGDVITGYIEKKPWTRSDGTVAYNTILNGVTADYVYELLLRAYPEIESLPAAPGQKAAASSEGEWETDTTTSDGNEGPTF